MKLEIISSEEVLYTGEVNSVTLPGAMGEFTVLRNHASLLAALNRGTVRYSCTDGTEGVSAIGGGIADVDNNVVTVCVY